MKRKRLILCVSSFLAQLSICMANFALIYYMREKFLLQPSQIGIASSIYTVTYFLSCLAFSPLFAHLKRKAKASIAFLGMAFTDTFIVLTESTAILYLMLALYGVAMSFLWPNIEDWITEGESGVALAKATGSFNLSWSLGAGLSTLLGGVLSSLSPAFPIAISASLFIFSLSLVLMLPKEKGRAGKGESESPSDCNGVSYLRYFSWCGNFLNYICYSLLITIFPLYTLESLGFSEALSGALLLFRGMATCFSFLLCSRLHFWQHNSPVVLFPQGSLSLLLIVLSHLSSPSSFALFFIVFGFVFAFLYEMSIFHGASGTSRRERSMVIHEVLLNVGMVLGASLGGIIYERYSFSAILHVLSALIFTAFVIEVIIMICLAKRSSSLSHEGQKH